MDILSRLNRINEDLLRTSLFFQVGAESLELIKSKAQLAIEKQREEQFRIQTLKEHVAFAKVRSLERDNVNNEDKRSDEVESQLHEEISKLQEETQAAISQRLKEQLIVKRMRQSKIVVEKLWNQNVNPEDTLANLLIERDRQSVQFLKLVEELKGREEELQKLKKENQVLRTKNRSLWENLDKPKEKDEKKEESTKESKKLTKLKEDLDSQIAQYQILSNVFQLLIIESGVNWAKDEQWMKFMMIDPEITSND
eukprot:TRINITY_DN5480_c0_g1_i1.p1 TRINITY_DN5480_c0_g1~~TRINITY_DN5480_c0_g1_i1.p1  ORF type:complete len:254 (-),score=71.22 TRINITY_DN5480_c0_g1_i1:248-1009(-)